MMVGERLGVGHEPRHGTAYVSSWIKALENDPKEIRAAAVDAQRISDWLLSRERERSLGDEKPEPERPEGAASGTPERDPERPPPAPAVAAPRRRNTRRARAGRRAARRALLEGRRGGGRQPRDPGAGDRGRLAAHPWPGNVRELQNVLANLTVTGPRYGPVGPGALPAAFRKTVSTERQPTLAEARQDLERAMVRDALGRHPSVAPAAGELGVTRQGLSKPMARRQIDRFDPGRDRSVPGAIPLVGRGHKELR